MQHLYNLLYSKVYNYKLITHCPKLYPHSVAVFFLRRLGHLVNKAAVASICLVDSGQPSCKFANFVYWGLSSQTMIFKSCDCCSLWNHCSCKCTACISCAVHFRNFLSDYCVSPEPCVL